MRAKRLIYSSRRRRCRSRSASALNVHIWLYQRSQGRIAARWQPRRAAAAHPRPQKTGKERVVPIGYIYESRLLLRRRWPGYSTPRQGPARLVPRPARPAAQRPDNVSRRNHCRADVDLVRAAVPVKCCRSSKFRRGPADGVEAAALVDVADRYDAAPCRFCGRGCAAAARRGCPSCRVRPLERW